jgi:hypothetical protein
MFLVVAMVRLYLNSLLNSHVRFGDDVLENVLEDKACHSLDVGLSVGLIDALEKVFGNVAFLLVDSSHLVHHVIERRNEAGEKDPALKLEGPVCPFEAPVGDEVLVEVAVFGVAGCH